MIRLSFLAAGQHVPVLRIAAVVAILAAAGCGGPTADGDKTKRESAAGHRPRVVATTTVVADLVRQVAGDRVEVDCLMAPGIDPHSYKATPRDAERLLDADLVVASGLHLEGRLATLLERLADRVAVLTVADRLPPDRILEAAGGIPDPPVWFDAGLWSLLPAEVATALSEIDPAGAETYAARAESYAARLREADAEARTRLATIPAGRRVLVTAHDAFRYFGRAYGIEVVGVQGTSTASEAGLGDINRLVELVVSRGIPAVFVETSVADRNVAAIIEGAAARGHAVSLGGRLYSDSLGLPESDGGTLEAALDANIETIVAALTDAEAAP
ncbi:MAG: zinc ABC transporter substrate-binding protein [Planctomycetota bacterium]|nr:zinc ABC transporter substrate-binding protein [Planctomycetota bacterium]